MQFPKEKMSFTSSYKGEKSEQGWLVLDIGNVELEGVTKIEIDLQDVETVKKRKSTESDALDDARRLLGGL
ncbi:MAG: hypothetical protein KBC96_04495 [Armatimonadetes bacterium]|nr:hypothetical protein [Armatimonadota bacterium]